MRTQTNSKEQSDIFNHTISPSRLRLADQTSRRSCVSLRSFCELEEYVNPALALCMSFMVFNIKQNIIIQYDMTSSSTGVGFVALGESYEVVQPF